MKAFIALALLAAVVAGCGAAKKTDSRSVTDAGTTNISNSGPVPSTGRPTITVSGRAATKANVKTGIWIRCKGWPAPGVKVPPRGHALIAELGQGTVTPGGTGSSSSEELQLTHLRNGSIRVVCKPSG
jgi:hypothetical protein